MRNIYIFSTLLILFYTNISSLSAQNLKFEWARMLSGARENYIHKVLVDDDANSYIIGTFWQNSIFSPTNPHDTLTSNTAINFLIAKIDPDGMPIWLNKIESSIYNNITDIAVDKDGNVYVIGDFEGTLDFDPGSGVFNMSSPNGVWDNDIFVSKFNPQGQFIWAKKIGGIDKEEAKSIAIDNVGNCVIFGLFKNTVDFDPGAGNYNLSSNGDKDLFIYKLDSSGAFIWAKSFGGSSYEEAYALTVDKLDNIYTTGIFRTTVDFDPSAAVLNLTAPNFDDTYINKLDANGNLIWVKQFFNSQSLSASDLKIDDNNNLLICGLFLGSSNFDLDTTIATPYVLSANYYDGFIGKYSPNGNLRWAHRLSSPGFNNYNALSMDKLGNVYTTGTFEDTVDFDPGPNTFNLISPDVSGFADSDIFIQKLDSNGNFIWATEIGTPNYSFELGQSIALDKAGNIHLAGRFADPIDFDPTPNTYVLTPLTTQYSSSFLLKLPQCIASTSISQSTLSADQPGGNYQWLDCSNNSPIVGATSQTFNPTTNGSYAVVISNNGCIDTSACYSLNSVNVEQHDENNAMKLYPNPVSIDKGSINIDFKKMPTETAIRIFNLQGQLLKMEQFHGQQRLQIELDFPVGLYILEIKTEKTQKSFKLIIQ